MIMRVRDAVESEPQVELNKQIGVGPAGFGEQSANAGIYRDTRYRCDLKTAGNSMGLVVFNLPIGVGPVVGDEKIDAIV